MYIYIYIHLYVYIYGEHVALVRAKRVMLGNLKLRRMTMYV